MYNIIFTRPQYKIRMGGVTTYIRQLLSELNKDIFNVVDRKIDINEYSLDDELTSTTTFTNIIIKIRLALYLLSFPYKLRRYKVDIVHANPSFGFIPLIRDGVFILISSFFHKKIFVFIHGWNKKSVHTIMYNKILLYIFKEIFNRADVFVVLSNEFRNDLIKMGIKRKILVEITMVSDDLVAGFDIRDKLATKLDKKTIRILFLARVLKGKGIYEAVDSLHLLRNKHENIELIIAGEGEDLQQLKKYVQVNNISNIKFIGYVKGEKKRKAFITSDIYILPSYTEGMPGSVLEAMAFGLPVVTRNVGGLKDFFENGKHGFITESKSPEDFAFLLKKLISDKNLRHKISIYNYEYAERRFLSSVVSKRIEAIYLSLMQ